MGVSINGGIQKWLVYNFIMEDPMKVDDLGVPVFQETVISVWMNNETTWQLLSRLLFSLKFDRETLCI